MTITILDRLEKPVLLFAIFHFAAYAKSREQFRLVFKGLDYEDLEAIIGESEAKLLRSQIVVKY